MKRINKRAALSLLILLPLSLVSIHPLHAAVTAPAASCSAGTCTVTFPFTSDYYTWTVPAGVTTINFDIQGAQGGRGYNSISTAGLGGRVQGALTTTPGATLYFYVGGQGVNGTPGAITYGGFNGGGNGGYDTQYTTNYGGASGGGASDIRTSASGASYSNRLVVAGGGGGGSGGCAGNGGNGGGTTGLTASFCGSAVAGGGGTQSAGGTANTTRGSTAGALGVGGSAGNRIAYGSGGGGGGFYGGGAGSSTADHGAGWGAGGGGGSSFTHASLVTGTPTHTQGFRSGNGITTITYSEIKTATTTSLAFAGNVTSIEKRKAIYLTATVTVAGKVTFFANGKRIAGCINKVAVSTTAACSVKASVMGKAIYTATYTPTSSSYLPSNSAPLAVTVVRRTGTR